MTRAGLDALRGGPGLGLAPLFALLAIWALIASHLAPSDTAVAADFGPATALEGGSVLYLPLVSCAGDACPDAVTVQGQVVWDTGDPVAGAQVVVRLFDNSRARLTFDNRRNAFQNIARRVGHIDRFHPLAGIRRLSRNAIGRIGTGGQLAVDHSQILRRCR